MLRYSSIPPLSKKYTTLLALILCFLGEGQCFAELVIFEVKVNSVTKGDVLVDFEEGNTNEIWIRSEDLMKAGVDTSRFEIKSLEGDDYSKFNTTEKNTFSIDLEVLVMSLDVDPALLEHQDYSFKKWNDSDSQSPSPIFHGFTNYQISYQRLDASTNYRLGIVPHLVVSDWITTSQHDFILSDEQYRSIRSRTTIFRDFPKAAVRANIGDVSANTGMFGNLSSFGGLSVVRDFSMKPGLLTSPSFSYQGSVNRPTQADVYIDGVRVRSVNINPGEYNFRDLYYFSGMHDVEIRLRDQFGYGEKVNLPFYFSNRQLKKGLFEFNYTMGVLRSYTDFQNHYHDIGLSLFHRVGVTDRLTVSGNLEASRNYALISSTLLSKISRIGVVSSSFAFSSESSSASNGGAFHLNYEYGGRDVSIVTSMFFRTQDFGHRMSDDGVAIGTHQLKETQSLSISTLIGRRTSLLANVSRNRFYDEPESIRFSLSSNWNIDKHSQVSLSLLNTVKNGSFNPGVSVTYSYNFNRSYASSVGINGNEDQFKQQLSIRRTQVKAEDVSAQLIIDNNESSQSVDTAMQYHNNYGALSISHLRKYSDIADTASCSDIRFNGALTFMDNRLYTTNTTGDGYALVKTSGYANVRVYKNNQLVGKTSEKGNLLVPNIAPYGENTIKIDDRDIPIDKHIETMQYIVSPKASMGTIVNFDIKQVFAIAGVLLESGEPVRQAELIFRGYKNEFFSYTGPDGDFYVENLPLGTYEVDVENVTQFCSAFIDVKARDEAFTELGNINCEPVKQKDI